MSPLLILAVARGRFHPWHSYQRVVPELEGPGRGVAHRSHG